MINTFFGEYRFLSNFYPCHIYYEGIDYPSVEHAYQASKLEITEDFESYIKFKKEIAKLLKAKDAKHWGIGLTLRSDWENVKLKIMEDLVRIKFNKDWAKSKLLATYPEELIEGNTWHDNYWGNCWCFKCSKIEGLNYLGKLLMILRQEYHDNKGA